MRRAFSWAEFAIASAFQNFRRNLAMSLTGGCTIGIILVLLGIVLLATHSIDKVLQQEQQNVSNLSIYLQDSASLASVTNFEARLQADPRIKSVKFQDKDVVEQQLRQTDPTYASKRSTLGFNPLPAQLDITAYNLSDLPKINDQVKNEPLVDNSPNLASTSFHPDVIKTLQNLAFYIEVGGLIFCAIFLLISLVIIMNTIRTAVFTRRTEVEIMKLVGATDWFVRWPFIVEGMISGIGASLLAGVLVYFAYHLVVSWLQSTFIAVSLDTGFETLVLFLLVLGGAALGSFGSYLGIRRFLNV